VVSTSTAVPGSPQSDASGRLDPVEHRHRDVHRHDVRMEAIDHRHGLLPVARGADDLEPRLAVQELAESRAQQELVVNDQDLEIRSRGQGQRLPTGTGSRAWTVHPPADDVPAVMVPPKTVARSRMPIKPCPAPSVTTLGPVAGPSSLTSSSS
jgi:hypothetical protein